MGDATMIQLFERLRHAFQLFGRLVEGTIAASGTGHALLVTGGPASFSERPRA